MEIHTYTYITKKIYPDEVATGLLVGYKSLSFKTYRLALYLQHHFKELPYRTKKTLHLMKQCHNPCYNDWLAISWNTCNLARARTKNFQPRPDNAR